MRLGLLGGTFNPIHYGHIFISEYIRDIYNLDKIIFIPSGIPPHKKSNISSSTHRMNMVKLAIQSNKNFEVSSIEVDRMGKSYTVDTLKMIKESYPDDEIYFIIGGDTVFELTTWKDFNTVAKLTRFILCGRPGYNEDAILNKIDYLKDTFGFTIEYINVPLIEISSTVIRKNIKDKKSIKYMVTEKVEQYIYDNNLYNQEDLNGSLDWKRT